MDIIKICAFGIMGTILVITTKKLNKEIGILLSILLGIMILIPVLHEFEQIFKMIEEFINSSGINYEYLTLILKIIGIAYIVEFGKNICCDAGETAIGAKIELAGKTSVVILTMPILLNIIELATKLI